MPAVILCPVSDCTGWAWTTPRSPAVGTFKAIPHNSRLTAQAPLRRLRHLELCGIALTFWKQQKRLAAKKSNRPEAVGHLNKTQLENWLSKLPIFDDTAKKKDCDIFFVTVFWWELVDSNHRSIKQQIYSLSPLATRESSHILFCVCRVTRRRMLL